MKYHYFLIFFLFLFGTCQSKKLIIPTEKTITPSINYHISAIEDFQSMEVYGFVKPYLDKNRKAMAINAVEFKNQFAAVSYLFNGSDGLYKLRLKALAELDGESRYKIAINSHQLKGSRTNPQIFDRDVADYAPVTHVWQNVQLKKGDKITVMSSSETNGKIPEGATTAYSRGRFTGIELISTDTKSGVIDLVDKDLSQWDIFMGVPHTSVKLEGYETFDDVRFGTPIGLNKDPKKVFSIVSEDGQPVIRISGEIYAGLITKQEFENYHLTWQIKWGDKKWPPRLDKKRNSGVLYHSIGDYTDFWNVWMTSLESEVQQTDCGDFITIGEGKTDVKAKCPSKKEGNKYIFDPNAALNEFSWNDNYFETGRCFKPGDPEKAHGEWNTMELYCLGNTSIHLLNGQVVMVVIDPLAKLTDTWEYMSNGKIQLQSEGAEVFYKNIILTKINEFPATIKKEAGL